MEEVIYSKLNAIEDSNHVRIFYACESGSRAWGFPSTDSDYDVRFLYIHPPEWYLTIENKRDVIEIPITDTLDITGWDIVKVLRLFRKSNPPLLEWLGSPIQYLDKFGVADNIRKLLPKYYSPYSCIYHYLHMAQGNYRDYLKGEQVWHKKYFYVLRPLLAIRWIEQDLGVAPVAFSELVDKIITSSILRIEIENLIAAKLQGNELDYGPRNAAISDFIESELLRLEQYRAEHKSDVPPISPLDDLFRKALSDVWQIC